MYYILLKTQIYTPFLKIIALSGPYQTKKNIDRNNTLDTLASVVSFTWRYYAYHMMRMYGVFTVLMSLRVPKNTHLTLGV